MKGIHKISQNVLTNFSVRFGQPYAVNKPIYIFLEVTNRCNLACIMCGRTHDPRYEQPGHCGDLTLKRVQQLDSFFPYATFTIPTGVGEPFINVELVPILKYLKNKGTQVSLTSNGTLLTKVHATEIIKCGLDKIVFSIDGATKKTFEKIRVHSNFDLIITNIRRLQQLKRELNSHLPIVEFELVAMRDNFHELSLWAELAADLGIQGLIVQNLFDHSGEPYEQIYRAQSLKNISLQKGEAQWKAFLETAGARNLYVNSPFLNMDLASVFGSLEAPPFERPLGVMTFAARDQARGNGHGSHGKATCEPTDATEEKLPRPDRPSRPADNLVQINSLRFQKPEQPQPMYCTQPWSVLYMAWNGDIRTCCFNEFTLGNIDQNSIDEIWNGTKYRAMRKSVAEGEVLDVCRDCLQGKSNYSVVPRFDPALLYREIRAVFHQALL